jgi:hypothetical protein
MLAAIVQRTTGQKLLDYLKPRLFELLGIENATWEESPQGIAAGGVGLSIKTEDLARFGQLYLHNGMWQGKRLLSEAWISEATARQISNGDGGESDWTQGYGYQFWRCRHGAYRADGVFGQYCIVMPEQDAVLAITGGIDVFDAQKPLDLLWEILLPAMHADPLPDDPAAQDALAKKLSSLTLPPVQGQATSSLASQISGRTYKADPNPQMIETIVLMLTESGGTVRIKTASSEEAIPYGYRMWRQGQTTLFNTPLQIDPSPIVASGAWAGEDCFTMVVRLYETPFFYTIVCHFVENEMMLEAQVNVSLESTRPLLLTASRI